MGNTTNNDLANSSLFNENILNLSVAGIYIYDIKKGTNLYVNEQYTKLTGYTLNNINSMSQQAFFNLFHPQDQLVVGKHMENVLNSPKGLMIPLEYRFKKANGDWMWCYSQDAVFEIDDNQAPSMFIGSFTDITDSKLNQQVLKEANDKLKIFNQELKQLSHITSHDLQEPINVIESSLVLIDTVFPEKDEKLDKYLNLIEIATGKMSVLLKDLQRYSQFKESNKRKLFNLSVIIESIETELVELIQKTNTTIHYKTSPLIKGNELDLRLVIRELILNAIKYGKPNIPPKIHIRLEQNTDFWQISVQDNGIGIDTKYQNKIFSIFSKIEHNDIYESGIGLALCKKIVHQNNGDIWVKSAPEQGSTFYFTLPIK